MLALVIGILGLLVGPLLMRMGRDSAWMRAGVDGVAVSVVLGAAAIWLLPHALAHAGLWAVLGVVLGIAIPLGLARLNAVRQIRWLGLFLLGGHVLVDGAALATVDGVSSVVVAVTVAVHRVPVGIAIAHRATSQARAALTLVALGVLTAVGYAGGALLSTLVSDSVHGFMEGAVVGVLLRIVLSQPPVERAPVLTLAGSTFTLMAAGPLILAPDGFGDPSHSASCGHIHHGASDPGAATEARFSAAGVLLGIGGLFAARATVAPAMAGDHINAAGAALLALTLTSAPALLAGFIIAGVVSAVIKPAHVQGGDRTTQAIRGVLYGLPLPICSCGVVPMYQSLIRQGVPLTAGLAFLVATPELGLDAVLLSVPLLGLPLTLARVVAAVVVALVVALWVGSAEPAILSKPTVPVKDAPLLLRLREGMRYGLVELVDHTLPWVFLGLAVAALAEPLIDHETLAMIPAFFQVPLAAVIGVPLYVCASGATPLAAVAVHKGLSAGAALTFLLAGPASNITTFGVLSQLHGRALAVRFGVVLTVVAVLMGWFVDVLGVSVPVLAHPGAVDAHVHGWMNWLCLLGLLGVGTASLFRVGVRGVVQQILSPVHAH
ncbi:MAG: hypothetical protein GWP91_19765 [Rhodobacterales bacterium]|nr:hypothetical protein [Rhodobacterales bacterium]